MKTILFEITKTPKVITANPMRLFSSLSRPF